MHEGTTNEDLLSDLGEKLKVLLGSRGTLALKNGDYWVSGIDVTVSSVDVLVLQTINLTPELIADCASLLDDYPENFRLRFIESGTDEKPLVPLGGLELNRYGGEPIK